MKAKEYLKEFMAKHGLSKGEIWEQHELIKLMEGYDNTKPVKNNCDLPIVVGQSEQLFCDEHAPKVRYDWQKGNCLTCGKTLKAK